MALIKCPECGKSVSDKAAACVHCGFPIASNNCYECGYNITNTTVDCPNCGAPPETIEKNDITVINGVPVDLNELYLSTEKNVFRFLTSLSEITGQRLLENSGQIIDAWKSIDVKYCTRVIKSNKHFNESYRIAKKVLENSKLKKIKKDNKTFSFFLLEAGTLLHGSIEIKSDIIDGDVYFHVYPVREGDTLHINIAKNLEALCR